MTKYYKRSLDHSHYSFPVIIQQAQNLQKTCEQIVYYVREKKESEIDKVCKVSTLFI